MKSLIRFFNALRIGEGIEETIEDIAQKMPIWVIGPLVFFMLYIPFCYLIIKMGEQIK